MKNKRLTTPEVAGILKVSLARVKARLKQGHFPNADFCECGRSVMIPANDLELPTPDGRKKRKSK